MVDHLLHVACIELCVRSCLWLADCLPACLLACCHVLVHGLAINNALMAMSKNTCCSASVNGCSSSVDGTGGRFGCWGLRLRLLLWSRPPHPFGMFLHCCGSCLSPTLFTGMQPNLPPPTTNPHPTIHTRCRVCASCYALLTRSLIDIVVYVALCCCSPSSAIQCCVWARTTMLGLTRLIEPANTVFGRWIPYSEGTFDNVPVE